MVSKLLKAIITVAIIGTVLFSLCLALYSCNPAHKIEKAEQIVITNPQSFEKIGMKYWELYRQPIDTQVIYKEGQPQPFPVYVVDENQMQKSVDSVKSKLSDSLQKVCNDAINEAYKQGAKDAFIELKSKLKPRVDTFFRPDVKCATILKMVDDSLTRANRHISELEAQNEDQRGQLSQSRKDGNKWLWYFIFAIAGVVATNTLWILLKIKGR